MPRKRRQQVEAVRKSIIVVVVIVAIGLAGYGILYGTGADVSGKIAEGSHYRLIEGAPENPRTIEVVEYFSYECVHCRNFDALIEQWKHTLPEGARFRRAHVAYSSSVALLARSHVALDLRDALEANHKRIFRAIHDRNRQFRSGAMMADYVDGYGIDREAFIDAFDSPRVAKTVRNNDQAFRDASLTGVPALVVAGKYVVNMDVGRKQSLDIAHDLVQMELAKAERPR